MLKDAEHRVCLILAEEKVEKLRKEKKLSLCLDARSHNFPIGTIIRVASDEFAKVVNKKHSFFVEKKGKITLAFEYELEPQKEGE